MNEPACLNCSVATLYPDSALRCDIDMRLAVRVCIQHSFGKPKLYRANVESQPKVQAHKIRSTAIPKTKIKPKQQLRLM